MHFVKRSGEKGMRTLLDILGLDRPALVRSRTQFLETGLSFHFVVHLGKPSP